MPLLVAGPAWSQPVPAPLRRLVAERRCEQVPWRHVRLGQILALPIRGGYAVVQVVRSATGPWALRVVSSTDGTGIGEQTPAELPLDHLVWRVLDRAGQPARVDPAAANAPTPGPGAVVHYHGDLTAHHGVYWVILADHPDDLVLRNDDGMFVHARPASVTVLA